MLVQSILRQHEKIKGFVAHDARWAVGGRGRTLKILLRERKRSRPICSGCGRKGPGYDRQKVRNWEYVPLWGLAVFLVYAARRVDCPCCGVTVERLPWAEGKSQQATTYRWFLAGWAKRLSWQETARIFGTSWQTVYRAVRMAVDWGVAHRDLSGIESIGVDEIAWKKGQNYLTLVYQIDAGRRRLLWIGKARTQRTLNGFFDWLGKERTAVLKHVCTDMWKAYLNVIKRRASHVLHVLDRFHISAHLNKAVDQVRREEVRRLKRDGFVPILKNSRWCLLKRAENRTKKETVKLKELLKYNLQTVKAHLLKEDFLRFWEYKSVRRAVDFFCEWNRRAMKSRLEPIKRVARTMMKHAELILNWHEAKGELSSGVVEGLNNKVKLTARKAYGYRSQEVMETALFHTLGRLPEPNFTHRFW